MANKTADHYQAMAERRLADATLAKDPVAKILLLEIAGRYEVLAERAAGKSAEDSVEAGSG